MSTWEERMSAKAKARQAAERAREEAARAEQERLESIAWAFAARAALLAAPPNPCPECYVWWGPSYWHPAGRWGHIWEAVVPGPPPAGNPWDYADTPAHWCHHACHEGEPVYTIPPAMAA